MKVFVKSNVKGERIATLGRVNLLVGANGSGKSAIMQAISLALTGKCGDLGVREDGASWATLAPLCPDGTLVLTARVEVEDDEGPGLVATPYEFSIMAGGRARRSAGTGAASWIEGISWVREHFFSSNPLDWLRGVRLPGGEELLAEVDAAKERGKDAASTISDYNAAARLGFVVPHAAIAEATVRRDAAKAAVKALEDRARDMVIAAAAEIKTPGVVEPDDRLSVRWGKDGPRLCQMGAVAASPSGAETALLEVLLLRYIHIRPAESVKVFALCRDRSLDETHRGMLLDALDDSPAAFSVVPWATIDLSADDPLPWVTVTRLEDPPRA